MKSIRLFFSSLLLLVAMMGQVYADELTQNPININTASAEELQQIKGVGKTRAQAIVTYREQHGPFIQVEDLLSVTGIGDATLARNRHILTVE